MGAFFFALLGTIPTDLRTVAWPPVLQPTLYGGLRYGYLIWFLAYFFIAALNDEENSGDVTSRDLLFGIVQGIASFTAVYGLGFILPDRAYATAGLLLSNLAILVICGFGLVLFSKRDRRSTSGINRLRWIGVGAGIAGMVVLWAPLPLTMTYVLLLLLLMVLWAMLAAYIRIRVDEAPRGPSEDPCAIRPGRV